MARKRLKMKGRKDGSAFMALPHSLIKTNEWKALTGSELKLLIAVYTKFNGFNNGDLSASWTCMKKEGFKSQDTLNRALTGLLEKGFLIKTRQGGKHRCSLFAVSWKPIDECNRKHDEKPTTIAPNTWKIKSPDTEIGPV